MADYISREAAWNGIYNCPTKTDADGYIWVRTKDVAHMIDDIPAADVRPVVHGTWTRVNYEPCGHDYICSECGCKSDGAWNFCHDCGADMREVKADEK